MKYYKLAYSEQAKGDLRELRKHIEEKLKLPLTAQRYTNGISNVIRQLKTDADLRQVDEVASHRFGYEVHRVNYKKMAILYEIDGEIVYIVRVVPQSIIW